MEATLGGLIKAAMDSRNLKGYELADRLGKQASFVSRLINDEIKETLPVADMEAIERELGIPQERMLRALGYSLSRNAPTALTPEREAVLYVLDQMEPDVARAYAEAGEILLRIRRTQTLTNPVEERVPALR